MDSVKASQIILLAGGTLALCLWLRGRLVPAQPAPWSKMKYATRDGGPAPERTTRPARPTRAVTLRQVYPLAEDPTQTDIDIIAIHGLDTNSKETWVWDPKGSHVDWLQGSDMLPRRFPTARIFTCDWPADLFEEPDFIQKEFEEFARLLLAGIKHRSPATYSHRTGEDRPIVFIASCLGGVILMKTLVMASQEYESVKRATCGIIFLATPLRGTSFQDVARWAEPGLRAWASIKGKKVCNMLELVKSAFNLGDLVRSFTTFCQENDLHDRVFTFYETGKSSLPRKIAPWLPASLAQEQPLVNSSSATLDIVKHPLPLDRPHVTMNKFYGPDDPGFIAVAGQIEYICCEIRRGRPIERADIWIRNKRYSPRELEIERLSGELLPMDRCYINLALVEHSAKDARRAEEDSTRKASPFSLSARLKTETPDKSIEVTLPTLFQPRKVRDGQDRRPSRILIRGRAGVGKTTLCKKIIHDFVHGNLWQDLFDRVLWVPLRNLKREERCRSPGYNFGSLFHDEYFSQHPEGKDFAAALWRTLESTRSARTLFILDGLDEVSQVLEGNMLSFFKELLGQPNVIITSRPHAVLPPGIKGVDLQLETIGFYPDQLDAYVKTAFTDPVSGRIDLEKLAKVQSYLQQHQIIQELVRIPVQLDALCFTWENFNDQGIPRTMTAVYQAIEHSLWKKDAVRLERRTEAQMQYTLPRQITNDIGDECSLLEILAFNGLFNNVIEFGPQHRDAISGQVNLTRTELPIDERLGRLSFLRTSDPSLKDRDRSYHFLHLTFQEYFAARYYVRQWKAGRPLQYLVLGGRRKRGGKPTDMDPTEFLRRHKYNTRYDIFWRFVAGLLDAEDEEEIAYFFEAIETEPLDMLGPMHQRLVMHCLGEVQTDMVTRKDLEEGLSQWLLFECKYTGSSRLAIELEFPEAALVNALKLSSQDVRITLLESLRMRSVFPLSVIDLVASWLDNSGSDAGLAIAVLSALEPKKDMPIRILSQIAAMLGNGSSRIRGLALRVLVDQAATTTEILESIAARLGDEDRCVRQVAVEALASQSVLSPEILKSIAARLGDKDWSIREAALKALTGQPGVLPDIFKSIIWDEDRDVRQAAVKALASQPGLSPGILESIAARLGGEYWSNAALKVLTGRPALSLGVLESIAARLGNEDWSIREAALMALIGQPGLSPQILESIAARLGDEDRWVRQAAVEALASQPGLSPEILKSIAALLGNKGKEVREAAVKTLTGLLVLSPEILESIAALLRDKDHNVRQVAVEVLASQPVLSPEILESIAARLGDEYWSIREAALKALTGRLALSPQILESIAARLGDEDRWVRQAALKALTGQPGLSPGILESIAARLGDEDRWVRQAALKALTGQPGLSPGILESIAARLGDEDRWVRQAALKALTGQPGLSPQILESIAARLGDEDRWVRQAVVKALTGQPALSSGVLESIAARLGNEDWWVRQVAVKALASQPVLSPEILESIAALLWDEDRKVRQAALMALIGQPGLSPEIIESIAARLEDEDWWVRQVAVEALASQPVLSPEILERIAALLGNEDWWVRQAAVKALTDQPAMSSGALESIAARLGDEDWWVRQVAVEALASQPVLSPEILKSIAARLGDEDWSIREAALKALTGQPGLSPDILKSIAALLWDEDRKVRQAAVEALTSQPGLSPGILESIAARLGDEYWGIREAALKALTGWPVLSPEILKSIAAWLGDKDSEVRHAAVEVLTGQLALPSDILSPYLHFLYRALLHISFQEPISWSTTDALSSIFVDDREVSLGCLHSPSREAIWETQEALGVPRPSSKRH